MKARTQERHKWQIYGQFSICSKFELLSSLQTVSFRSPGNNHAELIILLVISGYETGFQWYILEVPPLAVCLW